MYFRNPNNAPTEPPLEPNYEDCDVLEAPQQYVMSDYLMGFYLTATYRNNGCNELSLKKVVFHKLSERQVKEIGATMGGVEVWAEAIDYMLQETDELKGYEFEHQSYRNVNMCGHNDGVTV